MDDEPPDSEELQKRILAGDRDAAQALVAKYSRTLLFQLRRLTMGDVQLAEDIHQDTFEVVLKRLTTRPLDDPSKLSRFIRRTSRNLYIKYIRTQDRRKTEPDSDAVLRSRDVSLGPLEAVLREEKAKAVRILLDELNAERDKQILRRFFLYEEDKKIICSALELSSEHFDRVISRAKKRLREIIKSLRPELDDD